MSDHQRDYYSDFDGVDEAREVRGKPATVGETLADTRQRVGQELPDVAAALRIRLVYLRALEAGNFAELPGPTYASGFLRSYAEYLGLDSAEMVRRFRAEVAGRDQPAELYFPTPTSEGRAPGGTILLATLVVAALTYGGWYYLSATDRAVLDLVPALPERFAAFLDKMPWSSSGGTSEERPDGPGSLSPEMPAPTMTPSAPRPSAPPPAPRPTAAVTPPATAPATTASPAAPAVPGPAAPAPIPAPRPTATVTPPAPAPTTTASPAVPAVPVSPPATTQLPGITTTSRVVVEAEESETAPQEPTPLSAEKRGDAAQAPASAPSVPPAAQTTTTPTRVFGTQNKVSHIAILAKQDSWVQVREGSDQLFTRVLRPGDLYRLPDRPGLKLRTGNAGGLVIVKDGAEGPLLGSQGQVLRDFPLDQAAPGSAGAAAAGGE